MKLLFNVFLKCFLWVWLWILIVGIPNSYATSWRADWIDNTEPNLAGYYLYWRTTEGTYNATDKSWCRFSEKIITGLVPDNNFICVTAHDAALNESECSTEVLFDHNLPPMSVPSGLTIDAFRLSVTVEDIP